MATQLQIRRGTAAQVAAFTGAEGEIVYNSTNDSLHTNDGATAGGFELARADLNNVLDADLNAALTGNTLSALTITTLTAGAATFSGEISANGGIALGDNDKATFGDGDDLQIYSDGSSSYIEESGPGPLFIRSNGSGVVIEGDDLDNLLFADTLNDSVKLYADGGNLKLATTATGIDVTGTATMDGLTTSLGIDVNGTDDLRVRFLNGGSFKGGAQVATTSGDMITGSAVDDLAIRSQSNMLFSTGGATERMRIDGASGNVGIGNPNPQYQLDTGTLGHNSTGELLITGGNSASNDYTQTTLLRLRATSINPNAPVHNLASAVGEIRFNHTDLAGSASRGDIIFYTNPGNNASDPLERMSIYGNGSVTINETGLDADFRVESNNNATMFVVDASADNVQITKAQSGASAMDVSNNSSNGSDVKAISTSILASSNNTNCFHLKSTTQTVASYGLRGDGSSTFTSDARLKTDIINVEDGYLEKFNAVRLVNFKWKADPDSPAQMGVIAQEMEEIFPDLVVEDEDAIGTGETYKSVSYSKLNTIALKVIQELSAKVETLEARITALES